MAGFNIIPFSPKPPVCCQLQVPDRAALEAPWHSHDHHKRPDGEEAGQDGGPGARVSRGA